MINQRQVIGLLTSWFSYSLIFLLIELGSRSLLLTDKMESFSICYGGTCCNTAIFIVFKIGLVYK